MILDTKAEKLWQEEKATMELAIQEEIYGFEEDGNTAKGEKVTITDSCAIQLLIKMAQTSDFYDYDYGIQYLIRTK